MPVEHLVQDMQPIPKHSAQERITGIIKTRNSVAVALKDVVPGEFHLFLGQPIEEQQENDRWHPDAEGDRVNAFWMRLLLRKVVPFVEIIGLKRPIIIVQNHLRPAFEQERKSPSG